MPAANPVAYRERLYSRYVHARDRPLAPGGLDDMNMQARLHGLRDMVRRCAPPDKQATILDLGCGHGAVIHAFRLEGYQQISGVDGSLEQVEAARRLGILGVAQGDMLDTLAAAPAQSLDCVVTYDVIEHLTKTELISFVDEVHRVLRPGGRWIIHAPNGESPLGGKMIYWDFTHEVAFTRTSLTQLLMASGFASVECFEDRPVPHGIKSAIRAVLWRLIRCGWLAYIAIETGGTDRRAIFSQNLLAVAIRGT
ncbi:MAG: methyltransferase domain-containing protein [Candidatus Contendobacter sp.]|nr:methyltransferase domain-containing protein [Candidatus Contendobacter sp.]